VLFMWGVSAAVGIFVGGTLSDRFGSRFVIAASLLSMALAFMSLSASAGMLSQASALAPVLVAIIVWGVSGWSFFPAQQSRLIGIAGVKLAPIVLSLNASFMFIGFSLGAVLGSATLANSSPAALGWVGGTCIAASLLLMIATTRSPEAAPAVQVQR
jgi:predicted MFS family arabinose efflux permease